MKRFFGWLFIIVSLTLLVGPFLIPVEPLSDVVEPRELAGPDSRFVSVAGYDVHYLEAGTRGEEEELSPEFLLLHGFGASTFTWREVFDDFARHGHTVAYDRTAFGLTERPVTWADANPYSTVAQIQQGFGVMKAAGMERTVLVGNSAGGRTALSLALADPARFDALILVSPAVGMGGGGILSWFKPLLHTPQMDHLGPWLVRSIATSGNDTIKRAWHDPSLMTPEVIEGYRKPLQAKDWDRALWEFSRAPRDEPAGAGGNGPIESRLAALVDLPVLVITGDDDRIVPVDRSRAVAEGIPGSTYVELKSCGHVPQEECPDAFMQEVRTFLQGKGVLGAMPHETQAAAAAG